MTRFSVWSATTVLLLMSALSFTVVHGAVAAAGPGQLPGALIFARENYGCAQNCPTPGICSCADNERCELTQQTCADCPELICKAIKSSSGGVSTGAIAGASLGGIVVASILAFFVWKSCVKKRTQRMSMAATAAEKENDFGMLKSARASTHTIASIASTVRTRASNVIQIAYIPGVTNRSGPSTPAHLVPPVPPLPYSDSSPVGSQFPHSPNMDIQFAASDLLRGSMCTVGNRSSIATTIYGGSAIVSQPAIIRAGKAAVVTVNSKGGSSAGTSSNGSPTAGSTDEIPPVPALYANATGPSTRGNGATSDLDSIPPSPAFSVGSTFLNRMKTSESENTGSKGPGPQLRAIPGRSRLVENHSITTEIDYDSDDSSNLVPGHRRTVVESNCSSCVTDDIQSPFSDVNSVVLLDSTPPSSGVRDSRRLSSGTLLTPRVVDLSRPSGSMSPFDDSHSTDGSTVGR